MTQERTILSDETAALSTTNGSTQQSTAGPFWFLITLAILGFAPCVLFPVWRDYETLVMASRREQQVNDAMRAELNDLTRRRMLIETDPAVTLRASRRELSYRGANEIVIPVSFATLEPVAMTASRPPLPPVEPPAFVSSVLAVFPDLNYQAVFCHPPTRRVLMCLSGAVFLSAFLLYPSKNTARPPTITSSTL